MFSIININQDYSYNYKIEYDLAMIRLILQINHKQKKILVDLNKQQQLTVKDFLTRVIHLCQLNNLQASDLQLYDGQYLLPQQLPSIYITSQSVYKVKVIKNTKQNKKQKEVKPKKKSEIKKHKIELKIRQKRYQSSSISSEISDSSSSLQKFNTKPNLKKPQNTTINKKAVTKSKEIEKQNNRQSQKDSSSQQQIKPTAIQRQQQNKQSKNPINNNSVQTEKKSAIKEKSTLNNKKLAQKPSEQSSPSSDQSSHKYAKNVQSILTNIKNSTKNKQIAKNKEEHSKQNDKKQANKNEQKANNLTKSSAVPISVRNKMKSTLKDANEPAKQILQNQQRKLGHSLRPSYKQHQEQKWVPITKQILARWKEAKKDEPIVQINNQIRFKIMELDEEKFVPTNSGWIIGYVSALDKDTSAQVNAKFESIVKHSREEAGRAETIKNYEIPLHNMQELQIDKNTLNQHQKQVIFMNGNSGNQIKVQASAHPEKDRQNGIPQANAQEPAKKVQSMEQFVCGQINYYFSDKNYSTDLFLQMHANQNEQGFISLKLMLNFPKIKKFLTQNDEQKLWDYLTSDQKYNGRNYELQFKRRMIRKKIKKQ